MMRDRPGVRGHFYLEARNRHGDLIEVVDEKNVILDVGLVSMARTMDVSATTARTFFGLQVGDNGALSTNPAIPKTIDAATQTELYHELGGVATRTAAGFTAVQQGAPNDNQVLCQQSFDSSSYATTDFADITKMYMNEAMCFISNAAESTSIWSPFAMRTFKSVPFAPTDAITVLIKWTFIFEKAS